MVAPFPGGVLDDQRGLAFTRLADGEVVAVELSTGTTKWRRPAAGRPIGATTKGLVTLAAQDDQIMLSVIDAGTGTPRRTVTAPIPTWVAAEVNDPSVFCASAMEHAGDIEVVWKARQLYREGAAPPKGQSFGPREFSGRFVTSADGDKAVELPNTASAEPGAEPDFEAPLEVHRGDRIYSLESVARSPTEISVILRARDRTSGADVWTREIKTLPYRRPPALRM